jgi:hypothetical protein
MRLGKVLIVRSSIEHRDDPRAIADVHGCGLHAADEYHDGVQTKAATPSPRDLPWDCRRRFAYFAL